MLIKDHLILSEIRQAILYDDMLPLVDRQMNAK